MNERTGCENESPPVRRDEACLFGNTHTATRRKTAEIMTVIKKNISRQLFFVFFKLKLQATTVDMGK